MTDKPIGYHAEREYFHETSQLRRQLAGLELAVYIRKCIERELMERRWQGNFGGHELKIHFREGAPPILRHGELHHQLTIEAKTLSDQIAMINDTLAPHLQSGSIPEYTLEEIALRGKPCFVLKCGFTI
jgi:hypothetical protein